MIVGYARVSSVDQYLHRQTKSLTEAGVETIYADKQSGKNFDRPAYQEMLGRLRKGDVLIISSIDRLGRDYREIQEQWRLITKVIEADIAVLDMPLLDTRREKNLMGTFVADMVLQVLSFVAEQERLNIRMRQAQGIAAARARGVHLGRKAGELPPQFHAVVAQWTRGKISGTEAAKRCGMPLSTFRVKAIPLRNKFLAALEQKEEYEHGQTRGTSVGVPTLPQGRGDAVHGDTLR